MSLIKLKNLPRLKLSDLLRRRKMTLKEFLDEFGITTYTSLVIKCERLGVLPPSKESFDAINERFISNPLEGVVVVEPLESFNVSTTDEELTYEVQAPAQASDVEQKPKKKKKKEEAQDVS